MNFVNNVLFGAKSKAKKSLILDKHWRKCSVLNQIENEKDHLLKFQTSAELHTAAFISLNSSMSHVGFRAETNETNSNV